MNTTLLIDGFELHRDAVDAVTLVELREEAQKVQIAGGKANVRHLTARSTRFAELARSPSLLDLLPLGFVAVRSILFDKTPEENWPVPWHQDLTICVAEECSVAGYGPWSEKDAIPHVEAPRSVLEKMITLRLHLDDTNATNGALRVIPGSHKLGKISTGSIPGFTQQEPTICECRPGDTMLLSPLLLHSSQRSTAPQPRRVIHLEYAQPDSLHPKLRWFEPLGP